MKMRLSLFGFLLCLCSVSPLGAQTTIPNESPSLYKGTRPLGMGNAFVAMPGIDENAAFYNPAAINDYEKKLHMRILSPAIDFSTGIIGLVKDVKTMADDINAKTNSSDKVEVFRSFVNTHTGQVESVNVALPMAIAMHKYFTFATLMDTRNTVSLRNRAFTNAEIASRSDAGGLIGTAYNFKDRLGIDENFQVGLNVKVLYRFDIEKTITVADISNTAKFGDIIPFNRGTGVGFDLGLKGDVPTFGYAWLEALKPTLGLVWQDVGNTRFSGTAPNTTQSISTGFAVHPKFGDWQLHVANDFRELNQDSGFLQKWNIGAEIMGPRMAGFFTPSVRVGGNQGYIAAGTSLDFRFAKLEFATYGEEAGQFSTQKQVRRIASNISFGF